MQLDGSCHCGSVRFSLHSAHPYPFNLCYCSICRKTAGGGGYAINLAGDYNTMQVLGHEHVGIYQPTSIDAETGKVETNESIRHFCTRCGSALWIWDKRWPELVHPFASAIDSDLPTPPEHTHMMLQFKAPWVEVHAGPHDKKFDLYPDESIADWHKRLGLEDHDD